MQNTENKNPPGFHFINSYANLPSEFYSFVKPTPVSAPQIIHVNRPLADELNLDTKILNTAQGADVLAGNTLPPSAKPLAQVYAGHQFGHFNPQLGDGRAILLGDVLDIHNQPRDIQLKGAGPTPYSRSGDGRAALGPVIREYILSEAMHTLGIKTTRALAAVTTGESVYRQTVKPGAVITRVALSHIRIGTFEYFRSQNAQGSIKQLSDYVINRHYPQAQQAENPYLALLNEVIKAQASLVASWMHIGFIHGVMNTDNMSICGETIDYGPCAFMNHFDVSTVFSSIDHGGRYAYGQQPKIALWNLSRFAECLLPLIDANIEDAIKHAESSLEVFSEIYHQYWLNGMLSKIGIFRQEDSDSTFVDSLLQEMAINKIDYTRFFRKLSKQLVSKAEIYPELTTWLKTWKTRVGEQSMDINEIAGKMDAINPIYIPRNHLVEEVIAAAELNENFNPMQEMIQVLSKPFTEQAGMERYEDAPPVDTQRYQTFCGT